MTSSEIERITSLMIRVVAGYFFVKNAFALIVGGVALLSMLTSGNGLMSFAALALIIGPMVVAALAFTNSRPLAAWLLSKA